MCGAVVCTELCSCGRTCGVMLCLSILSTRLILPDVDASLKD